MTRKNLDRIREYHLKLQKITGYTHSKNLKSIQLLQKLNFKLTEQIKQNNIYTLTNLSD